MKRVDESQPSAMAFYNPKGFVPAFNQAKLFAGRNGRVGTLPDIIQARIASRPGDCPWETYFTTMSAEFVGLSEGGHPIAVVAHGIGPMSTMEGVLAAYSHVFNDKSRNNRGGRISQEEFLKLERGVYGDVHVVDLVATWNRREFQFSGHAVTRREIEEEPLWQARLGQSWQDYVELHTQIAEPFHRENNGGSDSLPCILSMDDAGNCSYSSREIFDHWMRGTPDTAIAHLLSIGGLANSHHQYHRRFYGDSEQRISLASDVACHEWSDGTRFLGIRTPQIDTVHPGLPSYSKLIETRLDHLWRENPKGVHNKSDGFWHLLQMGGQHFTDYPKRGDGMDNCEPEFLVTDIEELPGSQQLRTIVGGHHGFFKYGIEEIRRLAPPHANAYMIGDVGIEWNGGNPTHHVGPVTFYKVKVDTTKRLVRMDAIYRDFNFMMSLAS